MASTLQAALTGISGTVGLTTDSTPGELENSVLGTPSIQNTTVYSGDYAYQLSNNATNQLIQKDFTVMSGGVPTAISNGESYTWIINVRLTDTTPSTEQEIFDFSGNFDIRLNTNGDLRVFDSTATNILTVSNPFTVNTWHSVRVDAVLSNTVGEVRVTVDEGLGGTPQTSDANNDTFNSTATTSLGCWGLDSGDGDIYIDSWVCWKTSQLVETDIPKGIAVSKTYLTGDNTSQDAGDAWDSGTWDLIDELPFDETSPAWSVSAASTDTNGEYIATDADGATINSGRAGPSGDTFTPALDSIFAAKMAGFVGRGTGSGTTHTFCLDKYPGDKNEVTGIPESSNLGLSTSVEYREFLHENATYLPSTSDYIRFGIRRGSGGQDFDVYSLGAVVLYEPAYASGWTGTVIGTTNPGAVNPTLVANISNVSGVA